MRLRPLRRAARKVMVAAARRLPAARGRALVVGAQAAFTLITGRQTRATRDRKHAKGRQRAWERDRKATAPKPAAAAGAKGKAAATGAGSEPLTDAQREEMERAEKALELGQPGEALRRSTRLVRELPSNLRVRQLHAAALAGGGDAREEALALHRLHVLRDSPDVRRRERVAGGQIVAMSAGWLPRLPGPPAPAAAPRDGVVLLIADESGPRGATPSSTRLGGRLADLARSGIRAEVITSLGFPRRAGVSDVAQVEEEAGVPHHRLDLGPFYALDGPADRRLRDEAWLAAAVARRCAPSLAHALVGPGGADVALLGAALAQHLSVPLVLEVAADAGPATTPDAMRSEAALTHVLRLADRVITADAPMRARLIGRGLPEGQVAVVPVGGDLPAVYAAIAPGSVATVGA